MDPVEERSMDSQNNDKENGMKISRNGNDNSI